ALQEHGLAPIGRGHAVWILAGRGGHESLDELFALVQSDPERSVRIQAIRAIADLTDPMLREHELDCGRGDPAIAARLARLANADDPQMLREVAVALGRLRWRDGPGWLRERLKQPDPALAHATMQMLRPADNWEAVLTLLDEPTDAPIRGIALRAIADRYSTIVVDGLIERLNRDSRRRTEYAAALARVYKKPGPWVYWGYRPAPRP